MHLWRSLTTRVTLITLAIVMTGMWSLSLYTGRMLQTDMQSQLGAQQYSTASFIAANIDREFAIRLDALQKIAATVPQELLDQPAGLQQLMAQRPVFQSLFNAGTYATRLDGQPIASVTALPFTTSPADAQHIRTLFSSPAPLIIFLSDSGPASVRMAVPLHDRQGLAIGALVGASNLDAPNFLDTIAKSSYGKTGGYWLYSLQQRRMVMASASGGNAVRPAAEVNPAAMPLLVRAHDGSEISKDPSGEELLVSSKRIPLADWSISVMLPTREAFAPVREQQDRLQVATWLLTLLAGALTWRILRRQLSPIVGTVKALATLAHSGQPTQPLPFTRQFEIDRLIGGFNHLLDILRQRSEALTASVDLNQNTLDSVAAQIAVLDTRGRVMAVNYPWQHFAATTLGATAGAIVAGVHYQTLFLTGDDTADASVQELFSGIQGVLNAELPMFSIEYPVVTPGNVLWFHMSVTPLGADRKGVVISRSDMTERKRSGEQLRKLSRIAEQAPLSIVITDLRGAIEYANPYFLEKTGYSGAELLGKNPRVLKSGRTAPEVYQDLWATLGARRVWRGELQNCKKSGEFFIERVVIAPVLDTAGLVTHYVALKEDVTEDKQREQNRLSLSVRIEELSRRLVRTQEETRLRFSQELHDRTSPNLAALRINLDIIANARQQALDSQDYTDRIEDTRALIDDTTMSIREICAGLHPAAIERAGLLGVVQSYAQQFAKRTGLQLHVSCPHGEYRLPSDMELALFRIIQEALTNCAKHARASHVEIRLQLDSQPLMVSISDDGCGFDIQHMMSGGQLSGLGLLNMRETVEFAGGILRIESAAGQGTRIYVEI